VRTVHTCTRLSVLAALASTASAQYEPQCQSTRDYGWPRFNTREELIASPAWAKYFYAVYRGLPETYPLCVYDFSVLDAGAYYGVGLNGTRPIVAKSAVQEGDLFVLGVGNGLGIYHSGYSPAPHGTWVEVAHSVYPTELKGAWVWRLRGTGLWMNVGRTLVFPTPADMSKTHADAIAFLRANCSASVSPKWPQMESDIFGTCAREKGYDSIQFEPQQGQVPTGTFNVTGVTEMVLVNVDGDKMCGVEDPTATPLRSGWRASLRCGCKNEPIAPSCGLMGKPPPPMIREQPPLCKDREGLKGLTAYCNPGTCKPWSCAA